MVIIIHKLDNILSDPSKFTKITSDPTNKIKTRANKLITALNSAQGDIKLHKVIGDFKPGYIYGNVKIHKNNNPLRPIISQIPTATYQLSKTLNSLITPYMPNRYCLKSTNDFIDLLNSKPNSNNSIIASLDVESLFTNVPIDPTIDIITQCIYNHPILPPLKIPKQIITQLLQLCTKESPFRSPSGDLYLQTDGVSMGSPLGPTFANFYMGYLEEQVFSNPQNKPHIYARYIDDVLVQIANETELINLKSIFENNSVLKFTYELNVNQKLPFLDVLVDSSNSQFITKVYRKPTDMGTCLNANSFCPERYKISVIHNYLNRAYKISTNWIDFNNEVDHIKQMLINNNYSNSMFDQTLNKFLQQKCNQNNNENNKNSIKIFYHNQMHTNYKVEERVIKEILHNNIQCNSPDDKLNIIFYYKNKRTCNLVMKNNLAPKPPILQQTGTIYRFQCPYPHDIPQVYIGHSQMTLLRRINYHLNNGSIRSHFSFSII